MGIQIMKWKFLFIPMCLKVKLARNFRSRPTLWAAQWGRNSVIRKQKLETIKLLLLRLHRLYYRLKRVHYAFCPLSVVRVRGPVEDLGGQRAFPLLLSQEVFCEYSCGSGTKGSILSTRWDVHYQLAWWPPLKTLRAKLNLTVVTGINMKADISWVQMTVCTSRVSQWS